MVMKVSPPYGAVVCRTVPYAPSNPLGHLTGAMPDSRLSAQLPQTAENDHF